MVPLVGGQRQSLLGSYFMYDAFCIAISVRQCHAEAPGAADGNYHIAGMQIMNEKLG